MSCHVKIDPWGIAFENFDAVGSWRTQIQGQDIDASSLLYNEHELDGVDGVKRYLLANRQDQFARAIVHKMTTFALGRPLTFGDRSSEARGDGSQRPSCICGSARVLFWLPSPPQSRGRREPERVFVR